MSKKKAKGKKNRLTKPAPRKKRTKTRVVNKPHHCENNELIWMIDRIASQVKADSPKMGILAELMRLRQQTLGELSIGRLISNAYEKNKAKIAQLNSFRQSLEEIFEVLT